MNSETARRIAGRGFIGREELMQISSALHFSLPESLPEIPFSAEQLQAVSHTHILLWCPEQFSDGAPVTIRTIRERLAGRKEPRFYNQDWYLHEQFIDRPLNAHWALIPKSIDERSRGMEPKEISARYTLRPAVELTAAFMLRYLVSGGEKLWEHDYVWCEDEDDKGDQIYVGRYVDASNLNADGFEIHRHLKIKPNYGAF